MEKHISLDIFVQETEKNVSHKTVNYITVLTCLLVKMILLYQSRKTGTPPQVILAGRGQCRDEKEFRHLNLDYTVSTHKA